MSNSIIVGLGPLERVTMAGFSKYVISKEQSETELAKTFE
jgi:hypothetical protein